jgi:hypothetical protein
MKKITAITWALLTCLPTVSQVISGVYSTRVATWFGIDFTKAKMIGDFGNDMSPEVLRDSYYKAWNNLLVVEKEKYNLPLFFHKQSVPYSLERVAELNSAVEPDSIMLPEFSHVPLFNRPMLEEIASKYTQESEKGVGVLMVVEAFDKSKEVAILDFVFFDIATGRVYFTRRFSEKPHGAGLRNYWAKTLLLALEDTSSNWENWKNEEKKKGK